MKTKRPRLGGLNFGTLLQEFGRYRFLHNVAQAVAVFPAEVGQHLANIWRHPDVFSDSPPALMRLDFGGLADILPVKQSGNLCSNPLAHVARNGGVKLFGDLQIVSHAGLIKFHRLVKRQAVGFGLVRILH